jgi:serine/threonine protein kinase
MTHHLIAVKFFDTKATRASEGSSSFFREIDALFLLTHPCVLRIVGYFLETRTSPAQIGTEFAAGGSLREALPRLDDTEKTIVLVSIVLGMKFIHSQGVIHRDLKPANILLDEHGHPKIGDLGSSCFCDLRSTLTSGVGTPLYMAPEMYDNGDYTAAIDVYSFSLIVYEVLVGQSAFSATLAPPVLMKKVIEGSRPPLPQSMEPTIQQIIRQGWSVDRATRGSFEDILRAMRGIRFKIMPVVQMDKVGEFVALVDPSAAPKPGKQFLLSVKKGKAHDIWGTEIEINVPDGIIAHLTRQYGGNVHDRHVVDVTSWSLEKETHGANPHSGVCYNDPRNAAKNTADLGNVSFFQSAYRDYGDDIPRTRNNWVCYDFKERRIVPTHYAIRTFDAPQGASHLKSWLVETSTDGDNWREVAREEDNWQLNGERSTGTFKVASAGECRFIRLVNIGRNHWGSDTLAISAWEIFGSLIEE